jgi:GH43 family beta-xylosidase
MDRPMTGLFREPRLFPGQDPWVVPFDGDYLLVQATHHDRRIVVRRLPDLEDLDDYAETVVWAPRHESQIWAPELHHIAGRWYLYYAASDGQNAHHRMYVLSADHPLGPYRQIGLIADPTHDTWAIDLTVLRHNDALYAVWSGWEGPADGFPQNLYIAPMANPWTIAGERQVIARPEHGWEMTAAPVNEAPEVLRNRSRGKLFIVYSADASWTPAYKLGVLEWIGGDVSDPVAWRKLPRPILVGGGHASFVSTPAGLRVVYHRKTTADAGWADRVLHVEPYGWDDAGYPVIGRPGAAGGPRGAAPMTTDEVVRRSW